MADFNHGNQRPRRMRVKPLCSNNAAPSASCCVIKTSHGAVLDSWDYKKMRGKRMHTIEHQNNGSNMTKLSLLYNPIDKSAFEFLLLSMIDGFIISFSHFC